MKYQVVLDERNLTNEDLPNSQQKKISELLKLKRQIEEIQAEGVDESVKEQFEKIVKQFDDADGELVYFIRQFDVEKNKATRARLAEMRSKKLKPTPEAKPTPEIKTPEAVVPEVKPMPQTLVKPTEQEVAKKLEEIKKDVEINPESFQFEEPKQQHPEVQEVEAEEEFEKKGENKPRKVNLPLVIMGVGALLLTWGAVNFFKERK
jgi:hypothetical protein